MHTRDGRGRGRVGVPRLMIKKTAHNATAHAPIVLAAPAPVPRRRASTLSLWLGVVMAMVWWPWPRRLGLKLGSSRANVHAPTRGELKSCGLPCAAREAVSRFEFGSIVLAAKSSKTRRTTRARPSRRKHLCGWVRAPAPPRDPSEVTFLFEEPMAAEFWRFDRINVTARISWDFRA